MIDTSLRMNKQEDPNLGFVYASAEFWEYLDQLVSNHKLVINRLHGTQHPRYSDKAYPFDYGYLQGTGSSDGMGIDAWVGSMPTREVSSLLLTVDLDKRDTEVKLLIGCSEKDIREIYDFSNKGDMRCLIVKRNTCDMSLLETRRSVRRFRSDPVPDSLIEEICKAATRAPSAHNRQPWRFAILKSAESKMKLAEEMGRDFRRDLLSDGIPEEEVQVYVERSWKRITEAPLGIVLCMDRNAVDFYPDPERQQAGYLMAVQGVALAGGQMLIAVHSLGLGGVWMCAPLFAQNTVRIALDLPQEWEPQALILLGYPAVIPEPRPRNSFMEVSRIL